MERNLAAGAFAALISAGAVLSLLAGCQASPGDAAAQVPGVQNGHVKGDTSVIVRRVWEGDQPSFWASEVSPDGRYLTDAYWYAMTGDLAVIDLVTGERKRVTRMKDWTTFAESAVFSPDGRQVAYLNFDGTNCPPPGQPCNYEIRAANFDGSNDRLLLPGDEVFYGLVYGWVDDQILALLSRTENGPDRKLLGFLSTKDGSFRLIKDLASTSWGWAYEGEVDLSPDGRYAAYDVRSALGEGADIVIVSTADGSELGRIEGPADDRLFAFAPDGTSLLFGSDRELTEGIWSQPLRNGRPQGDPVLLRGDLWRAVPIGTSDDALFFGVTTQSPTVQVATFDPETGALLSDPTAVEASTGGRAVGPVWSPDGRHLAYSRVAVPSKANSSRSIVIRSVAGDDVRDIPVPHRLANLSLWTEDGRILASDRHPETGEPTLFEVNLETGALSTLWTAGPTFAGGRLPVEVVQERNGRLTLFYMRGVRDDWTLVRRDLATGQERDLISHEGDEIDLLKPSPDGRTLAIILSNNTVVTVPGHGGAMREIHRGLASNQAGIVWTPDSRYFFFMTWRDGEPPAYTLWRGDAERGEAVQVSETDAAFRWARPVLHPDGRRIAFEAGEARAEVWMMTNLPGARR